MQCFKASGTAGGFGYSSQTIGIIVPSQAIVALVAQACLVPFVINKLGALKTYRTVLTSWVVHGHVRLHAAVTAVSRCEVVAGHGGSLDQGGAFLDWVHLLGYAVSVPYLQELDSMSWTHE